MPSKNLLPDKIRFLNIYGISYYIAWEELHPGCSFFIKTTATAQEVKKLLIPASIYLKMDFKAVNRVEFDYYGVRVWRL